jgi:hypothetical protein
VGLEIAEIIMDLEDEFCIIINEENVKFGTLVIDFENMVVNKYNKKLLSSVLNEIVNIDNLDNSDQYEKLLILNKWLPQPRYRFLHIFLRHIDKDKLITRIENAMNNYKDENDVRSSVRNIITKRLCLKSPALSNQDLIKDLGC